MYDVVIIGCGVSGASCAYMLSRYNLKVAMLDKSSDVSNGTTKANSAIIHAGYDPSPDSLMAKLNVRGTELAKEIAAKLDVPINNCGSMVLAFDEADLEHVQKLCDRGIANGVPGIRVLTGDEAREIEPELAPEVVGALYAPSSCIINPWEYGLAMAETAVRNGVEIFLNTEVTGFDAKADGFTVKTDKGDFETRFVISATGVYAAETRSLLEKPDYEIVPTRGQYFLLDKEEGKRVGTTIFQCPNEKGKGVLVSPTVDGNLIVGPDAIIGDADDKTTDKDGLDKIAEAAKRSVPKVNFRMNIKNFAGVRANSSSSDFIIQESEAFPGFIDLAGIKSPGLSAAPAIAEYVVEMLRNDGLELSKKADFIDSRKRPRLPESGTAEGDEARRQAIAKDPAYGRIICRCETVSEGEIVAALHTPIPPTTINGVKRRVGAGMGRCQGGFCMPKVQELIARELGKDWLEICLDENGSEILAYKTKEQGKEGR
ncbi:MAG: NAD(P)/FAD-dependent oxidoreductase [Bacillota bacterium]|nr:NAD(P)/FAD-dependent oxidoreductase [Bacillota bacterium]